MRKNKWTLHIGFIMAMLLLSSCSRTEDAITLDYWKANLKRPGATDSFGEDGKDITQPPTDNDYDLTEDIYGLLGKDDTPHKSDDFITNLFISFKDQIKLWGQEGINSTKLQEAPSLVEVTAAHTSIVMDATTVSNGRIPVIFERVVDGDTILVTYKEQLLRVRLIGINTPESVHADSTKNTPEGVEASNYLKELLIATTSLWLEFDQDTEDDYDRTLAYVWLSEEGTDLEKDLLNGVLLKSGHAEVMTTEPNTKYASELAKIR